MSTSYNLNLFRSDWCRARARWCRAYGLDEEAREWTRLSDYWQAQAEKVR